MPSRTKVVEAALRVELPRQYEVFLETHGAYESGSIEVYGLTDDTVDVEKMPCVIGATKIYRRARNLPERFLAIHHTDEEDEMICLDTENGKVYSISRVFGNREIADSFDQWFQRDIIEYEKEKEKEKEKYRRSIER